MQCASAAVIQRLTKSGRKCQKRRFLAPSASPLVRASIHLTAEWAAVAHMKLGGFALRGSWMPLTVRAHASSGLLVCPARTFPSVVARGLSLTRDREPPAHTEPRHHARPEKEGTAGWPGLHDGNNNTSTSAQAQCRQMCWLGRADATADWRVLRQLHVTFSFMWQQNFRKYTDIYVTRVPNPDRTNPPSAISISTSTCEPSLCDNAKEKEKGRERTSNSS